MMLHNDDQWIQAASGLLIPKFPRMQREQQPAQPVSLEESHDPEPVQDWKAHWKVQEQPWRREPEIDLERQQFLQQQLDSETKEITPFDGIPLERADLEWLVHRHHEKSVDVKEQPHRLNLQSAILSDVDCKYLPLKGANFSAAQLEGADFSYAQSEGANFFRAQLRDANFSEAQLGGALFFGAQLEGALFFGAQLSDANFYSAQLKGADFSEAQLKGADFSYTKLEGADFSYTNLEGADFSYTKLEGAGFSAAQLEGAHFSSAKMSNTTFGGATMVTPQGVGPIIADATGWDERSLPIREWSQVKQLGDEAEAQKKRDEHGKHKDALTRFEDYFAATRAYRQIATALDGMGRKEEAATFAYRGQVMQRKMLWWSIWQQRESARSPKQTFWQQLRLVRQGFIRYLKRMFRQGRRLAKYPMRTFWRRLRLAKHLKRTFWEAKRSPWQRLADGRAWLFSWLLTVLSGYGYRFGRSFGWYVGVLLTFAWLYLHISQGVPPHSTIPDHLSWFDAAILSISDMVGRGFFRQDVPLSDPYAGWSVLEGMIGVFMDVLLISTLTQRLFKK